MEKAKKIAKGSGETDAVAETPLFDALKTFSATFLPRTKEIVWARFGLSGKRQKTLEAIGHEYGITRERVRQILGTAFSAVRQKRDEERFVGISDRIVSVIEEHGGIMTVPALYAEITGGSKKESGALSFFLQGFRSAVKELKETSRRERAYATASFSEGDWRELHSTAEKVLSEAGRVLGEREFYASAKKAGVVVGERRFFDLLSVSSRIMRNPFGYWGFADSDEISPRGTREKARLVLTMNGSPMHFKEIAERIDEAGLQKKGRTTHPQTVHNELIKDSHFVLVGRGLYALSDWGYKKGTVRQVIADVLREHGGSMSRDEIVSAVSKARKVKRSTIVINLNSFFEKVGKDGYTVKD